jgi:hypothetical protein
MILLSVNNASTTLGAPLTSGATNITLATGSGALFPSPATNEYFTLTLNDQATGDLYEICWCTSRTGDSLTVLRGQEGTSAQSWALGDFAYNALTAGGIADFTQIGQFTSGSNSNGFWRKSPDGFIEQFGSGNLPNSGATVSVVTITFPIPFTTTVYDFGASTFGTANSSLGYLAAAQGKAVSLTQGEVQADTMTGDAPSPINFNQTMPFTWHAFGI